MTLKCKGDIHRSLGQYVNEILKLKIAVSGFSSLLVLFEYPAGVSRSTF